VLPSLCVGPRSLPSGHRNWNEGMSLSDEVLDSFVRNTTIGCCPYGDEILKIE